MSTPKATTVEAPAQPPHPLVIEQVANGYLVHHTFKEEERYPRRYENTEHRINLEISKPSVFQTFDALAQHLREHYTHREHVVPVDRPQLVKPAPRRRRGASK